MQRILPQQLSDVRHRKDFTIVPQDKMQLRIFHIPGPRRDFGNLLCLRASQPEDHHLRGLRLGKRSRQGFAEIVHLSRSKGRQRRPVRSRKKEYSLVAFLDMDTAQDRLPLFSAPLEGMGKRLAAFRMTIPRGNLQPDKSIRLLHTFRRPPDWLVPPRDYRQQPVQPSSTWELNGLAFLSRPLSFCFSIEGASGPVHNNVLL